MSRLPTSGSPCRVSRTSSACTGREPTSQRRVAIFHSECQITYIMQCIDKLITDDIVSIEPTVEAYETYDAELQAEISQMV